jgi:hypothetical protein
MTARQIKAHYDLRKIPESLTKGFAKHDAAYLGRCADCVFEEAVAQLGVQSAIKSMKSRDARILAQYIREGRTVFHFRVQVRTLMPGGKVNISYKHGYAKSPEAFAKKVDKEITEHRRFVTIGEPQLLLPQVTG